MIVPCNLINMCICVLQLQYMEYWCATSISILDSAIHLNDQVIQGPFFLNIFTFKKYVPFTVKHMKKVEQKLRWSNQLINLSFFLFLFPYQTWKPDNHCHPTTPPFSCPSHLCVCTAAISKSISCHFLFLLAQFYSLHLSQGDKLLPRGLGWTISVSPL